MKKIEEKKEEIETEEPGVLLAGEPMPVEKNGLIPVNNADIFLNDEGYCFSLELNPFTGQRELIKHD